MEKLLIDIDALQEYINKATFNLSIKPLYININEGKVKCIVMDNGIGVQLQKENNFLYNLDKTLFNKEFEIVIGNSQIFKKYLSFIHECMKESKDKFIICEFKSFDEIDRIKFYHEKLKVGFSYFLSSLEEYPEIITNDNDINLEGLNKLIEIPYKDFYKILENFSKAPGKTLKIYTKNQNLYIGYFNDLGSYIEYTLSENFKTNDNKININFNQNIFKLMKILDKDENHVIKIYYLNDDSSYYGVILIENNINNEIERFIIISNE